MLKSDLIDKVVKELNMNHDVAQLVVSTIFESMVEALSRGEGIEIRGFGSFSVRNCNSECTPPKKTFL